MLVVGFQGGSGGGGGGLDQLTGDVLAGPGTGSQAADVVRVRGFQEAVYVDVAGSDVTGNGTFARPLATYAQAVTLIGGAANAGAFYSVQLGPGTYSENIALVSFIFLDAATPSSEVALTGTISLDPSVGEFSSVGISGCFISGAVALDYTAVSAPPANTSAVFVLCEFEGPSCTITGNGINNTLNLLGGSIGNIDIAVIDASLFQDATDITGNLTMSAPSHGASAVLGSGSISDNILIDGSAGHNCNVQNQGTTVPGAVNMVGTHSHYVTGIGGLPGAGFGLSGGAIVDQITQIGFFKNLLFVGEYNNGSSGAAIALKWTRSNLQLLTLNNAAPAIAFSADPAGPCDLTLHIVCSVGSSTPTWPASIKWGSGHAPTFANGPPIFSNVNPDSIVYLYFDGAQYWGTYFLQYA